MKKLVLLSICLYLFSCSRNPPELSRLDKKEDSIALALMIKDRELAMINKDMDLAMEQFTDDVSWINSQGYYFSGKEEVDKFHQMLAGRDSLDYYYEAGAPRIRVIDPSNALAYYSWKMFWYNKYNPADTVIREIGLMSLSAHKEKGTWKWIAVTNQHTPWFYEKIEDVKIE